MVRGPAPLLVILDLALALAIGLVILKETQVIFVIKTFVISSGNPAILSPAGRDGGRISVRRMLQAGTVTAVFKVELVINVIILKKTDKVSIVNNSRVPVLDVLEVALAAGLGEDEGALLRGSELVPVVLASRLGRAPVGRAPGPVSMSATSITAKAKKRTFS